MDIHDALIDESHVQHLAKHGVKAQEVLDICYGEHFSQRDRGKKDHYVLFGQTSSGRYLSVVVQKMGKGNYYVRTAFEMSENDKNAFRRKLKGRRK